MNYFNIEQKNVFHIQNYYLFILLFSFLFLNLGISIFYIFVFFLFIYNIINKKLSVSLENNRFRFANLKSYRDPNFLPGAVKYGDLLALMKLCRAEITK